MPGEHVEPATRRPGHPPRSRPSGRQRRGLNLNDPSHLDNDDDVNDHDHHDCQKSLCFRSSARIVGRPMDWKKKATFWLSPTRLERCFVFSANKSKQLFYLFLEYRSIDCKKKLKYI